MLKLKLMAGKQNTCISNFTRRFNSTSLTSVKRSDYLIETSEVAELIAKGD